MSSTFVNKRARRRASLAAAVLAFAAGLVFFMELPASAAGTTYEAESAALSGGAVVQTDHTGYTGTGFVGGYTDANKGLAKTTFTVSASSAGNVTTAVRYANGTSATMTLSLYVNGTKIKQISLGATADWNTWTTETETVALHSGSNTIAYSFDSTDTGNVNVDNIVLTAVAPPPPGTYEAESAALSGGAVVQSDHTGYTGTGFVGGYTDGNLGNAATTFTISAPAAGTATLTLRYANGNGSAKTLSLYVNATLIKQISLGATADWNTWASEVETVTVNSGSNTVAYKFDSTDTGNVNLDNLVVTTTASTSPSPTPSPSGSTTPPPSGQVFEAESGFVSGGPTIATSTSGYTGTGYVTTFSATGARVIINVNVPSAGNYTVTTRYANSSGSAKTLDPWLNGVKGSATSFASGSGWLTVSSTMALRSGVNLVEYSYDSGNTGSISIDNVTVTNGVAMATRGATLPYTEFVASAQPTNGTVLAANRTYLSLASEATGRRAVQLTSTGQYVQFTLTKAANSVDIRYSIPDTSDGVGQTAPISLYANNTKVQDITLTSKYSWTYGAYPYDNNPSEGQGHHFYDETRAMIGNWPAGTVLKVQKDSNDTAASYTIDVIDTEQVDAAYAMPANYLSVTSYGATANDGSDDTNAINSAISAAESQGKGVWLPSGVFNISSRLNIGNVSFRGAGEWYTTLQGAAGLGGLYATGNNTQVSDLTIDNAATYRNDSGFNAGIEGNFGTGSLVFDVWMDHDKVGMWPDSGTNGLYVDAVRIRDQWADGINLHANIQNTVVSQSSIRNTGDDAMAMFSDGTAVTNSAFTFNTIADPMLANGIGIYGGNNDSATDNLVSDIVVNGSGITVSTNFGIPFSGPILVTRNTLNRSGSYQKDYGSDVGAIWIYAQQTDITNAVTISYNTINDSTYQAILLSWDKVISNLLLDHDTITTCGTYGIDIYALTGGSTTANYVTVTGAASGGLNNTVGYTIIRGAGDTGW
jgi:Pectate lyase superfamily protein/Carbohydrate binding module (family 35)/Carbohydrate binding module (family 6)